jgi:hypothetical protein
MKKYFAVLIAVLFVFSTFGLSFAQAPTTSPEKSDTTPVKKTEKAEKRQQMTPDKKKAYDAPAAGEGSSKSDTSKVKKSEKQKKRQAETPEKKQMKEDAAKTGAVKGN